jgi:protein dithiol oxidoreductase (disulfide-forming)
MSGLFRGIALTLSLLASAACSAEPAAAEFKEGTHYKKVREAQAPADPRRVTVEEFFWYGCGFCYRFEPALEGWAARRPADVDFIQVPNSLGRPEGILHSKAYYAAEALGVLGKMHPQIFAAMHERRFPLNTESQIATLFETQSSVLPDVFAATFNGFAVDSRVRRAEALSRSYGISSTPTIVVGGTYYTNPGLAGDFQQMLRLTDHLIAKVRKERGGK